MRPLTIDLQRLEQALLSQDDAEQYLDLESGTVLRIAAGAPAPGSEEKYLVQPDRYLAIESLGLDELLAMREAFLFGLHDPHAHTLLSHALNGRRPLRTFDYELEKLPHLQRTWQAYQAQQARERALEWLQANGLEAAD
ncbi:MULTISPECIES: UPF0158 family protein [unclassified Pseudomonas]|uniref:UPF0158 family protein n=1 Tax=unclassified Pseudomonas TaxID=196821 RepID=UPI001EE11CCA|nr:MULTISPECIES: UPF0158 family protein [unclassified Pseudomonas]MCG4452362.1 UPF0158 family protein [Pseudomonas sp. MMS21 TM103]